MATRNVNLTEHYDRFVEAQVASGQFENASEVMRAGLRLLEQQRIEEQAKLAALRTLAGEAFDELDQGLGITLDGEEQLKDYVARISRSAGQKAASSEGT